MAGTALGTPAYMSPEQASGRLDMLGPATDVYSLGATLYTLLTGKLPIEENDAPRFSAGSNAGEILPPRLANPRTPAGTGGSLPQSDGPGSRRADMRMRLSLAADVASTGWPMSRSRPIRNRSLYAAGAGSGGISRWSGRLPQQRSFCSLCLAAGLGIVSDAYRQEKEARQEAAAQEEEAHRQQRIAEARAERIEEHFRADREASDQIAAWTRDTMPVETRL